MRVLAITDIHGRIEEAYRLAKISKEIKADIITISGDISTHKSIEIAWEILKILNETGIPVAFVLGNIDNPQILKMPEPKGTYQLQGRKLEFMGHIFTGMGGSLMNPFSTFLQYTEEEIKKTIMNVLRDIDGEKLILITHNPPQNTKTDVTSWGEHVGSVSIREIIEEKQPRLNICGHIHEAKGIDKIGRTYIVNPGPAMRKNYAIIDIKQREVKIQLLKIYN